ncbi:MAG: B12-binding domain-containing protein [Pirellulaceae bacterium]
MTYLTDLYEAILCGDAVRAEEAARCALAANTDAQQLLTAGVIPSVHEACRRFQAHDFFVPELLVACRAMKKALKEIRPRAAADGFRPLFQVSVISLAYQANEMTGRLVADLLEGAGFEGGKRGQDSFVRLSLCAPAKES